jgi:hypothetical protein
MQSTDSIASLACELIIFSDLLEMSAVDISQLAARVFLPPGSFRRSTLGLG